MATHSSKQNQFSAAKGAKRTNIMIFVTELKKGANVIIPRIIRRKE
jgi:hypothetical protein